MIRDFRCLDCGTITEDLVPDSFTSIDCSECSAYAYLIISPIKCQLDSSFPGQADKWARQHEQGAKHPDKAHVHY